MVNVPLSVLLRALLLLGLLISTSGAQAAVKASIDRDPVALDESFTLLIESDSATSAAPDLAPLSDAFEVISQSQSSAFRIINGRSSSEQRWNITLTPKQEGKLTIPPLQVGNETTRAIPVTVTHTSAAAAAPADSDIWLEVSAQPTQLYVQQQVIFSVQLWLAVNLANGFTLSAPRLTDADAVVEQLGEGEQYQASRGGRRYMVLERRYAIYPQKSGQFTIAPLQFDGRILDPGRGGFMLDPFGPPPRMKRLRSKELTLEVKPRPTEAGSGPWLPATKVTLVEQWSPDPPTFKVGEPVTRALALMADGLTSAQLPPLTGEPPTGLKAYADQPDLHDNKDTSGITGVRQEKIALVPSAPGEYLLPALEIPWWNVTTGKREIARLPARTIKVTADPAAATSTASPPTPQTQPAAPTPPAPIEPSATPPAPYPAALAPRFDPQWWPWLSLILGSGWLLTLLAWGGSALRRRTLKRRLPTPAVGKGGEKGERQQVYQACHNNDPTAARQALLAWARTHWPEDPPTSLLSLAERVETALASELQALDHQLYAADQTTWQGAALQRAFSSENSGKEKTSAAAPSPLTPLWHSDPPG